MVPTRRCGTKSGRAACALMSAPGKKSGSNDATAATGNSNLPSARMRSASPSAQSTATPIQSVADSTAANPRRHPLPGTSTQSATA